MLLRFTLGAAGAMVLASTATAQNVSGNLQPITSPVKDAGVYHMSTGTWTRGTTSVALAGPDVLYDNTCSVGYFTALDSGETTGDSGRLPSVAAGGLYNDYEVNGFQIAYCSFEIGAINIGHSYWNCYAACDAGGALSALTPVAAFSLVGVPGGGVAGTQACWLVTFDLANTTFSFNLQADCNGTYDNAPSTDSFGWGWTVLGGTTGTVGSGPLLAGDPNGIFNPSCGVNTGPNDLGTNIGVGTGHPGWANAGATGSGIGNVDQFELESVTVTSGCYWFGGYPVNPWAAFWLELQGAERVTGADNTGASNCDCSAGHPNCFTVSGPDRGCPNGNANGLGAKLVATGNLSKTSGLDTFAMSVTDGNPGKPGLVLTGSVSVSLAVANGAGILCNIGPGGTSARGAVVFLDASGAAALPDFQGAQYGQHSSMIAGTPRYLQYWFRDPGMHSGCTGDDGIPSNDFNFSNGWAVTPLP
jgi:hypothetical protein